MKKIILSVAMIAAVAAVAIGATTAFFSDTETSTGNTFTAGAIDLQIDSECTVNNEEVGKCGEWAMKDLSPTADKFFNFSDIKPGDKGENTISLHVTNNDAWGCVNIIPTKNDDVSSNEPELTVDVPNTDSIYDGELAQNMTFKIWADMCNDTGRKAHPGDNIYTLNCEGDRLLTSGNGPITPTTYVLADSQHPNVFTGLASDPLDGSQPYYLGVEWSLPIGTGNIVQTDTYQADVSFNVVQSRNNAGFVCPNAAPAPHALRLENETMVQGGPWIIKQDSISGLLTWTDGNTFDYTLTAQGLPGSTPYSLIYYADGWPGNHPGALIGSHTTAPNGTLNVTTGSTELGMDLPAVGDGNYAIGAKIWLIPSSAYNSSTKSVTAWPPDDTWLFEGNVYIHYDDTNI